MKVTYDEQVDAVYCYLSDREAARTIQVSRHVLLDLDSDENLRGISILDASRIFPADPPQVCSWMRIWSRATGRCSCRWAMLARIWNCGVQDQIGLSCPTRLG